MVKRTNRRGLLKAAAWGAAGWWVLDDSGSARGGPASEKLNVALVGAGSRGTGFVHTIPATGHRLVAICDANQRRAEELGKKVPQARRWQDFRRMLDELDRALDAVIVATPDHTHATIAAAAMRRGKHVYVEKPIAHDVGEARTLRELAARFRLATQMGNQGMAADSFRRTLELLNDGAVGEIREAHAWYGFGGSGPRERPKESPQVPEGLDWDLWLGPAPFRPYHPSYVTGWGGWRDFSTGCLGGGGSHSINLIFKGLKLGELWRGEQGKALIHVEAKVSEVCTDAFPRWEVLRYDFPARGPLPPAKLHWYNAAEAELQRQGIWERLEKIAGRPLDWKDSSWVPRYGSLLVGSKGVVHTNAHNSRCALLPEKDFPAAGGPPRSFPHVETHEVEWLGACRGGPAPLSNFEHSGPVIELLLLGNIATLVGRALEFDPVAFKIVNDPEADRSLRAVPREGWAL